MAFIRSLIKVGAYVSLKFCMSLCQKCNTVKPLYNGTPKSDGTLGTPLFKTIPLSNSALPIAVLHTVLLIA